MKPRTTLPLILAVGALSPAFAIAQQPSSGSARASRHGDGRRRPRSRRRRFSPRVARRRDDRHFRTLFNTHQSGRLGHDRRSPHRLRAGESRRPCRHRRRRDTRALSGDGRPHADHRAGRRLHGRERARCDAHRPRGRDNARRHRRHRARHPDAPRRAERGRGHGPLRARRRRERDEGAAQQHGHALAVQLPNTDRQLHGHGEPVLARRNLLLVGRIRRALRKHSVRRGGSADGWAPGAEQRDRRRRLGERVVGRRPRALARPRAACDGGTQRPAIPVRRQRRDARLFARTERQRFQRQRHLRLFADGPDQDLRHRPLERARHRGLRSVVRRRLFRRREEPDVHRRMERRLRLVRADGERVVLHRAPQRAVRRVRPRHRRALDAVVHADGVESARRNRLPRRRRRRLARLALQRIDSAFVHRRRARRSPHAVRFAGGRRAKRSVRRSRLARAREPAAHRRHAHRLLVAHEGPHGRSTPLRRVRARPGDDHRGARRLSPGPGSAVPVGDRRSPGCAARARGAIGAGHADRQRQRDRARRAVRQAVPRPHRSHARQPHGRRRRHRRGARRGRLREAPDLAVLLGAD